MVSGRGSVVWGGAVVSLSAWIVLEFAAFSLGRTTLAGAGQPHLDGTTWVSSTAAAVVALALGGAIGSALARGSSTESVVINAALTWATTTVAVVLLTTFSSGVGFGGVGRLLVSFRVALSGSVIDPVAQAAAQQTAGRVAVTLLAALAAAALGALGGRWLLVGAR